MNKPLLLLLLMLSGPAFAEGTWRNEYLANQGGSRMVQVEEGEHHLIQAVQSSSSGERLTVSCYDQAGETNTWLGISKNGHPYWGRSLTVTAGFGSADGVALGTFNYAGGRYSAVLPPELAAELVQQPTLILTDLPKGFSMRVSLEGAAQAINNVACFEGK